MAANSDPDYLASVGDYKAGSITCIKLKNFLTHENVTARPGPRLNVVVGANGTGKSTLLNALCLGLGGEPKILGRADDLRAFIMHGKDMAEIEITVAPHRTTNTIEEEEDREDNSASNGTNATQQHVFRRVIDGNKGSERGRGRGSSTFYINGTKSTIQQVRDIVQNVYHISIDNLCTFLPQDKVGNFSGFSDQERLVETEKTLATAEGRPLRELHEELILLEENLTNEVGNAEALRDKLKKLQHENERLEREKERMEERQQALAQVELHAKKLIWLKFDAARLEGMELRNERVKIKDEAKKLQKTLQPLELRHAEIVSYIKGLDATLRNTEQQMQRIIKEMEKQKTKFDNHDDEIQNIQATLREIDAKRAHIQANYDQQQAKLAEYEATAVEHPPKEQIDAELLEANEGMKKSRRSYEVARREDRTCQEKLRELEEQAKTLQSKLARMNDEGAQRKENIFREQPNLRTIYDWLEKNRGQFRRQVWGPVACEVTTKSRNAAAFLEFHVPNHILRAFVVETKADYDKLYNIVRNELKNPINVVLVEDGLLKPLHQRLYSPQKMKTLKQEHGIIGYLDESFTAPDAILEALRSYAGVHRTLVGTEDAQRSIDDKGLLDYLSEPEPGCDNQNLQSSCIFASQGDRSYRYTQNVSRYSKKISSRVDDVGPPKLLSAGINPRIKQDAEDALAGVHEKMNELRPDLLAANQALKELEAESQQYAARAQAAKNSKDAYIKFEGRVARQRAKLKEIEDMLHSNESSEKQELASSLMNRVAHSITALELHSELQTKLMELTVVTAGTTIGKNAVAGEERAARTAFHEKQQEFKELEQKLIHVAEAFNRIRQKVVKLKEEADRLAPLEDEAGNPTELKAQLDDLQVSTISDVEAAMEDYQLTANKIADNPDVVRQYEQRKIEIEDLERSIASFTSERDARLHEIHAKRAAWESTMVTSLAEVNTRFSRYMQEMGLAGEVRLKKSDAQEGENANFKDWGIEILVSFRDKDKPQILSAQSHSGGERSVSTILYLMALQDMMVAPFRCVDEINQGLDDRNERLVFRRIVQNSTTKPKRHAKDHSGQYFLITPKLLPNLVDMENDGVTILFVYNGPLNFQSPTDFDIGSLLAGCTKQTKDHGDEDMENSANVESRRRPKRRSRADDDE